MVPRNSAAAAVNGIVVDNNNGCYNVEYTVQHSGAQLLEVRLADGHPIVGSPFTVLVSGAVAANTLIGGADLGRELVAGTEVNKRL